MLELKALTKRHGNALLLDAVSWQWPTVAQSDGVEVVALLGPSGAGKSTLLRIIAGLEIATSGEVLWANRSLATVPVERRGFALMFQQFALFPHLNVRDNVAFGLREQGVSKAAARNAADAALVSVGLAGYGARATTALSGGEQQRVALARALAPDPKLLLMDEPFSNLDSEMRRNLSREVRDILIERKISAILVTHDQEEAFTVADETGVMLEGNLQQWGSAEQLREAPANEFVARFIDRQH